MEELQSLCREVILVHLKKANPSKLKTEAVEQLNLPDSVKHYLEHGKQTEDPIGPLDCEDSATASGVKSSTGPASVVAWLASTGCFSKRDARRLKADDATPKWFMMIVAKHVMYSEENLLHIASDVETQKNIYRRKSAVQSFMGVLAGSPWSLEMPFRPSLFGAGGWSPILGSSLVDSWALVEASELDSTTELKIAEVLLCCEDMKIRDVTDLVRKWVKKGYVRRNVWQSLQSVVDVKPRMEAQPATPATDRQKLSGDVVHYDQDKKILKSLKHISSGAREWKQVEMLAKFLAKDRHRHIQGDVVDKLKNEGCSIKDNAFEVMSSFYTTRTDLSKTEKLSSLKLAMCRAGWDSRHMEKLDGEVEDDVKMSGWRYRRRVSDEEEMKAQLRSRVTPADRVKMHGETTDYDQNVDHEILQKVADSFSKWEEVYALGELLNFNKNEINRLRQARLDISGVTYGIFYGLSPGLKWERLKAALVSLDKSSVVRDIEGKMTKAQNETEWEEIDIPEDATSTNHTEADAALEAAMKRTSIREVETDTTPPVLKKPRTYNQDMSAKEEMIDSSGGEICIEGVRLSIPQGALNCTVQITLSVLRSLEHVSDLETEEALLSPVVSCEPHGLQFEKPVTLSIPHCAYNIKEDWPEVSVMKSETDPYTAPDWETVSPEGKDVETSMTTESCIVLEIMHFTLYRIIGRLTGRRKAKLVQLEAVSPKLEMGRFMEMTVYAVNDYARAQEEGKRQDKQPLQFHSDGGNLHVNLVNPPKGWTPRCPLDEQLHFDLIWQGASPSCKFVLEPTPQSVDMIYCEIKNFQEEYKDLCQTLKVTQCRERVVTCNQFTQSHAEDWQEETLHAGYQMKKPASQTWTNHVLSKNGRSETGAGTSACQQSEVCASGAAGISLMPHSTLGAKSAATVATQEPPLKQPTVQQNQNIINDASQHDGAIKWPDSSCAQQVASKQRSYSSPFWPRANPAQRMHNTIPNPMLPSGDAQPKQRPVPETPHHQQALWGDKLLLAVAHLITENDQITELGIYLEVDRHSVQRIISDHKKIKMRALHVLREFDEGNTTGDECAKRCKLRRALCELGKADCIQSLRL